MLIILLNQLSNGVSFSEKQATVLKLFLTISLFDKNDVIGAILGKNV